MKSAKSKENSRSSKVIDLDVNRKRICDFRKFCEPTTAKRLKIDPYCHRRYCSTLTTFQRCKLIDCVDIAGRSSARGGVKQEWGVENKLFSS